MSDVYYYVLSHILDKDKSGQYCCNLQKFEAVFKILVCYFSMVTTRYLLFYRPNENLRNSAKLIFCHLKEQMNFKIKGYQSALWLV